MLLKEKSPSNRYLQITDAPTNYPEFLNFFRGGQSIDNNLDGDTAISRTVQANMLKSAVESGHVTRVKNMAVPDESLLDITLTKSGQEFIQPVFDRKFCQAAIAEARKSVAEDDRLHPKVGVVIVKDGKILATGYRGESGKGDHGEYCALKKLTPADVQGATAYTTLEPCSERKPPKKSCTDRLIEGKVARVVYGMGDKHVSVYGHPSLQEAGIAVGTFPDDLMQELLDLNKEWTDSLRVKPIPPPPNDTSPLAGASYRKPGTSILDTIHLHVRPPKHDGGYYTIQDNDKNVLDYARTFDEIASKWHAIDAQKRIMEKMQRVGGYNNSDQRLGFY
ncbi:MAG TPA: deaminase [Candidatus Angelobacter sp.]|jgi:pyrimidine deaminase RibD-like protein|nr:deaminase [Candidatus Angelobacter sp.]